MKTTPLHAAHKDLGASLVPFGGWDMPVTYSDIRTEHAAVRTAAGLFDISHMGRVRFIGKDSATLAHRVQTCGVDDLAVGRTRYALVLNQEGGIIDDVLVSRESEDGLLFVVNAGNRDIDLDVFQSYAGELDVEVRDDSESEAMIAIQGPRSPEVLDALGIEGASALKYYRFGRFQSPFGEILVSRTGYTGEIGYELILPADVVRTVWDAAIERGEPLGLIPCGLGARDTLRLEAGMPLHGQEIGPETNPYEAGIGFAVRSEADYTGRAALEKVKAEGPARTLVGLVVSGPRIARTGSPVLVEGVEVGHVCSGTLSPTLGTNIATALVNSDVADGERFTVRIRRHEAAAARTSLPFYKRRKE